MKKEKPVGPKYSIDMYVALNNGAMGRVEEIHISRTAISYAVVFSADESPRVVPEGEIKAELALKLPKEKKPRAPKEPKAEVEKAKKK
jgi:hypothetical protein